MLLIALSLVGKSSCIQEDRMNFYNLEYGGLKIAVDAPIQSNPGENISISIKAEAIAEIFVKYIRIEIFGALNATEKISLGDFTHLENSEFTSSYEFTYNLSIPKNMVPGLTYGVLSCEWELMGSPQKIPESGFVLTYIRNVNLEQLQADYESLNNTYQTLIQEYTDLESSFQEDVENTQNLNLVLIATTVVAGITVVVLLLRKPKKIWI
jgi:hypothetical protein